MKKKIIAALIVLLAIPGISLATRTVSDYWYSDEDDISYHECTEERDREDRTIYVVYDESDVEDWVDEANDDCGKRMFRKKDIVDFIDDGMDEWADELGFDYEVYERDDFNDFMDEYNEGNDKDRWKADINVEFCDERYADKWLSKGYDGRQYGLTTTPHDERQWKGYCDDTRVYCYSIDRPSVSYIIWDDKGEDLDDDGWQSVIMHELGHALGYETLEI